MKKLLACFLFAISLLPVHAQMMMGLDKKPGAAAYVGPGDVISGAKAWWGLRGYNAAYAGNAANVCLPADVTCDNVTISSGNLVVPGTLVTCNNSTVKCTIKILYDQSGAGTCSGACDLTQATEANRPVFVVVLAANGCTAATRPCMSFPSTKTLPAGAGTGAINQAFTVSTVFNFTDTGAQAQIFSDQSNDLLGMRHAAANDVWMFAGASVPTATAANGSYHALQGVFNNASSDLNVDGSVNTVNLGASTAFNGTPLLGAGAGASQPFNGFISEIGIWPSGFSGANSTSMSSNQHTYWGF